MGNLPWGLKDNWKRKLELRDLNITWWPNLGVNYWGITKCANTKIRSHLFELERGRPFEITQEFEANFHFIEREEALSNDCENLTIVRDPVERFRSAWKDLCRTRPARGKLAGIEPDWSPTELAEWLQDVDDSVADVHFKSQSWFVPEELDYELNLEEMASNWPFDFPAPSRERVRPSKTVEADITQKVRLLISHRYATDFQRFGFSTEVAQ
ncbi:MAG TPA: hypothetical protein DDW23_05735 [Planctomycetes bacterium]|nr:hypothetical protein [Planctomycetota bacterium]